MRLESVRHGGLTPVSDAEQAAERPQLVHGKTCQMQTVKAKRHALNAHSRTDQPAETAGDDVHGGPEGGNREVPRLLQVL